MSIYDYGPTEANRTRANFAWSALETFGDATGQHTLLSGAPELSLSEDLLHEIAGDLLCDLLHLAQLNGCSAEDLITQGLSKFHDEVQEETAEYEHDNPDTHEYECTCIYCIPGRC